MINDRDTFAKEIKEARKQLPITFAVMRNVKHAGDKSAAKKHASSESKSSNTSGNKDEDKAKAGTPGKAGAKPHAARSASHTPKSAAPKVQVSQQSPKPPPPPGQNSAQNPGP